MTIPINGRIAIVDDKIEQAMPLIQSLSNKRLPFVYYDGKLENLPEQNCQSNDVRLLFLDLYLNGNTIPDEKTMKATLIAVLRRIIRVDNYPYLLVYWSRHADEHTDFVKKLFSSELKDRAPIDFIGLAKSDFFEDTGELKQDAPTINQLFEQILAKLADVPIYSYLLQWENLSHISADSIVQEIFNKNKSGTRWLEDTKRILSCFATSYVGKDAFSQKSPNGKIVNSFQAFNSVYFDTLDYLLNRHNFEHAVDLPIVRRAKDAAPFINSKLLFSRGADSMEYPGSVFETLLNSERDYFGTLLKKLLKDEERGRTEEIKSTWITVWMCVTPLCDVVQNKQHEGRFVRGIIVDEKYLEYFHLSSEAIFKTPCFEYNSHSMVLLLDFRHLFTLRKIPHGNFLRPLFRAKQQLLAEVQSMLARHVNRQGILFLEKK